MSIVIGAPFGNWVTSKHAISTVGTYTLKNRAGFMRWWLYWRLLYTLRYRSAVGGWTNKLGLPNPGIEHLAKIAVSGLDGWDIATHPWVGNSIVSIHGFSDDEWKTLAARAFLKHFKFIEYNLGCPNVGHAEIDRSKLFSDAVESFGADKVIVKLSPVSWWRIWTAAFNAGIRQFHCTNTLPVPAGGLSGKALKRVSLDVIQTIRRTPDGQRCMIIGGGGITSPEDVRHYAEAGADHFSVASALLNPMRGFFRSRREEFLASLAASQPRSAS